MTARWAVAKYVDDLRRDEPDNVGVILWADDGTVLSRFLGERLDGTVDGRSTKWTPSPAIFKAWVDYWRTQLAAGVAPEEVVNRRRPGDNYFLAEMGERLYDGDARQPDELLDYLFGVLIEETPTKAPSVERIAEEVLARTGIKSVVQRDFRIPFDDDDLVFDYRFDNGHVNLLQRANLGYEDDRSWTVAHDLAWSYDAVRQHGVPGAVADLQCATLVRARPPDADLRRQLRLLGNRSEVISLDNTERASSALAQFLEVPLPTDHAPGFEGGYFAGASPAD